MVLSHLFKKLTWGLGAIAFTSLACNRILAEVGVECIKQDLPELCNPTIAQTKTDPSAIPQDPTQFNVPLLGGDDKNAFFIFGVGAINGGLSTLHGPTRNQNVLQGSSYYTFFPVSFYFGQRLSPNQTILEDVVVDVEGLGFDISYNLQLESIGGLFSFNFFNSRFPNPAFQDGNPEIKLANGQTPIVNQLGGGIEYLQTFSPNWAGAIAINYQKVSVRDALFTPNVEATDADGNALTVSNDGQDDLLTINLATTFIAINDLVFPTEGIKIRFGIDQAIPVGDASINYTRLSGEITNYFPVNIISWSNHPDTLILDLQAGVMWGDVPPYDAFNLGGSQSVRGYNQGQIGTASSFLQVTAEYRFPLFDFEGLKQLVQVKGSLFVDYATAFDTQNEVIGEPGVVRDKDGDGLGYGLGVILDTSIGFFRFESGWTTSGDYQFSVSGGDRF